MSNAAIVQIPIDAQYTPIERDIENYLLSLFLKYKETDIPGNINMSIDVQAHSGARELEIKHKCTVGSYPETSTFTSSCMSLSLRKAIEHYRDQRQHRVLAIAATEDVSF